jgi:hypothetical protein
MEEIMYFKKLIRKKIIYTDKSKDFMNRKHIFFILFFTLSLSVTQATPDRQRYIMDRLIGLHGNNIIVHQYVADNLQSHYNGLQEEYIIEKFMENGKTTIIKQIRIPDRNNIENILLKEYNGKINYIFPDIQFYNTIIQPIINEGYIIIPGEWDTRYNLRDYIPKELINCKIMRVVDIYFINEYIYLTIDLQDEINNYRKIIMFKYE